MLINTATNEQNGVVTVTTQAAFPKITSTPCSERNTTFFSCVFSTDVPICMISGITSSVIHITTALQRLITSTVCEYGTL